MNVFKTYIIPAGQVDKASAICNALGYPEKGMFDEEVGIDIAYISSGLVRDDSPILGDAAVLWTAVQAGNPGSLTLTDCQAFKAAIDSTALPPVAHAESIVQEVEGTLPSPAWVQPLGSQDAYRVGASVSHNGKKWRNLTDYNVWEPGVSGWREHWSANAAPPDWIQPTGAHDAYRLGAKVTYNGHVWTNTGSDANVWAPGVYGWTQDA